MCPQPHERLVDADTLSLRDGALGLLDDDPAVQRSLQLLGQDRPASHGAFLQEPDGGHVREGLGDVDVGRVPAGGVVTEHADSADDLVPQPERERVHRQVPRFGRTGRELWPAVLGVTQGGVHDRLAVPERVQAGPFVHLDLEQLESPDVLVGARHELQVPALVRQQDPDVRVADQLGRAVRDHDEELDHVEVVDQGIGQLDEHVGKTLCRHDGHGDLRDR
jgi:hypothetical protein